MRLENLSSLITIPNNVLQGDLKTAMELTQLDLASEYYCWNFRNC